GHKTLRLMALGMEDRAPNNGELLDTQEMLEEGLNAGALRSLSGSITAPGCFNEPDELHSLGSVSKSYSAR
ncbi:MAG: D-aminoacylase, partial [Pseudomonadota bacterium]|nr:D-aminoacylase [Pseudomonadota bacterium]